MILHYAFCVWIIILSFGAYVGSAPLENSNEIPKKSSRPPSRQCGYEVRFSTLFYSLTSQLVPKIPPANFFQLWFIADYINIMSKNLIEKGI